MNKQEQLKENVIKCCVEGKMTVKQAANRLWLSEGHRTKGAWLKSFDFLDNLHAPSLFVYQFYESKIVYNDWCYRKICDFSYNRTKGAWLKFFEFLDYLYAPYLFAREKLHSNFFVKYVFVV